MKNRLRIAAAILAVLLAGGCSQSVSQEPEAAADMGVMEASDLNIEKQLKVILDNYEWEQPPYESAYYMFAISDLDKNGTLELIVSSLEGTGQYTYSEYYEVNRAYDGLTACEMTNKKSDSEADITADRVPVYYDSDNHVYYYIFHDTIKDGTYYYENKRAISLADGKLSECILAYKTTHYEDDLSDLTASVTCKDADGREISEDKYDKIDETIFSDFIKKEASFSWFNKYDLNYGSLSDGEIAALIRKSYEGFLIQ